MQQNFNSLSAKDQEEYIKTNGEFIIHPSYSLTKGGKKYKTKCRKQKNKKYKNNSSKKKLFK